MKQVSRHNRNGSVPVLPIATLLTGVGLLTLALPQAMANPPIDMATAALLGQTDTAPPTSDANSGPVRLARFTYIQGNVTWRGTDNDNWAGGAVNMPLRQGAQIWVNDNSRAEIQFDDGSRLRLDHNTLITLQTLYSDAQGEFTEINLNDGETDLRLTNKYSVYQVNSPLSSVKATGPASVRVGSGDGLQIGVRKGSVTVEGTADKANMSAGDYLDVVDANAPYTVRDLPREDVWDRWNDARDRQLAGFQGSQTAHYLPANIAVCSDNLDAYGTWRNDPTYGAVWVPAVTEAGWRPYYHGHWTWVEPFGWTWVGNEAWGWAPYHYGSWFHASYGWGWRPGPVTQYWSPAVVSFYNSGGSVAWCPLAPREVHYPPTLAIGFHSGNWSAFFSIGGAAVYYPGARAGVYEPRPWRSNYVNNTTIINRTVNVTNVNRTTINNTYVRNNNTFVRNNYIPANAAAGGASSVSTAQFGHAAGAYQPVSRTAATSLFRNGQAVGAPVRGRAVAGPSNVQVTRASFSPNRTFQPAASVPHQLMTRSVYRAPLPASVVPTAAHSGQSFVNTRPTVTRSVSPNPGRVNPNAPTRTVPNVPGRTNPNTPGRNNPVAPGNNPGATGGRPGGLDAYLRERNQRNGGTTPNRTNNPGTPGTPGRSTTPGTPERNNPTPNPAGRPETVRPNRTGQPNPGNPPVGRSTPAAPRTPEERRPLHNGTSSPRSGSQPNGGNKPSGGGRSNGNEKSNGGGHDNGKNGGHDH